MKRILLTICIGSCCLFLKAQTANDYLEMTREVIKVEKKAAIAEVMQLSEDESQPFWSLYNEYQGKLYEVQNKRIALIKEFSDNYEKLSEEKADELWTGVLKYQQELLKLKSLYYKQFKKIIPASKAARFMQAENKIETLINAQIAVDLPLIESN